MTPAGTKQRVDHYSLPRERIWQRCEKEESLAVAAGTHGPGGCSLPLASYRLDFSVQQPVSAQETASLSRYNKTHSSIVGHKEMVSSSANVVLSVLSLFLSRLLPPKISSVVSLEGHPLGVPLSHAHSQLLRP